MESTLALPLTRGLRVRSLSRRKPLRFAYASMGLQCHVPAPSPSLTAAHRSCLTSQPAAIIEESDARALPYHRRLTAKHASTA